MDERDVETIQHVESPEREWYAGHMAAHDWLVKFLSHFIFKLNYFIAN
jgi:hypothetical protein